MRPSLFPSAASSRRRRGPVPLGNRGQFAEDLLETVHDIYRLSRQADVTKIPTPVGRGRQIEQGHFEAWYIQPSVSDYLGTVAPEGRGLALELKSVLDSTFSLIKLAPHQRAFLDRWDRMGALAYLLVLFRGTQLHPRGAVLKWPAFLQEIEAANLRTQRFSWERLATAFRASAEVPEASGPHPDYLPAIRTVEARVATEPHRRTANRIPSCSRQTLLEDLMECHCLTWKDGWLCMRSESPLSSEPTTIVSYYPLVSCSRVDVENRVTLGGRYRYLGDGAFRELDGDGKARTMHLKDGGATLPIATEQVPIQRPRCRVQTRWYNGRWEKYLAREGWVPA